MTFEFKSFEHFKQVRIKAAQWRAFAKQLKGAEGEELICGVLQEPVIDNRTDRDYEKRLYEGFKEGMRRLREGVPLVDKEPPKSPPKDQFREACISLGYLPPSSAAPLSPKASSPPSSSPRASPPSPRASPSSPRASPAPSPYSPSASGYIYPSVIFQRTPSPLVSPSSSVLLKATPPYPSSPSPIKTPTRIFSPSVQKPSLSPTPPPTPRDSYYQTYSDRPSSEEIGWYPKTPSPARHGLESASFQPAIVEETKKKTTTTPATMKPTTPEATPTTTKPTPTTTKPTPKRKRRKQQLKFSDEALKK